MTPAEYKAAREQLGLTQVELADRLGVSVRTIKHRESGRLITREAIMAMRLLLIEAKLGAV